MPRFRGYQGMRRRNGPRPFVKTFKKIINSGQASVTSGANQEVLATGVDAIAPGQTTATDPNVPTGSRIRYLEIQFACVNLTAGAVIINMNVQFLLSGQATIDPNLAGGHPQRNQMFQTRLFSAGPEQNSNHVIKFKIPPKFQRVKEGMSWVLSWNGSQTVTRVVQTIYKFES